LAADKEHLFQLHGNKKYGILTGYLNWSGNYGEIQAGRSIIIFVILDVNVKVISK